MDRLVLFQQTLEHAQDLYERNPHLFPLKSAIAQLNYAIRVETGIEADRSPLTTMNLGFIAVRELDNVDDRLEKLLCNCQQQVEQMAR